MSIEKIIQSVKENSISNNDDWFKNLEPRKKEEVILHDKLRDMDFRKKIHLDHAPLSCTLLNIYVFF